MKQPCLSCFCGHRSKLPFGYSSYWLDFMRAHITALFSSFNVEKWCAGFLVTLGAVTMFGWLLHIPAMVEIQHGLVPMVFNTGLCFFLCGAALLIPQNCFMHTERVRQCLGVTVTTLTSVTLLELFFDRSLGVDLAALHTWYDYGNTRPGRMAPNTATGFALMGVGLLLSSHISTRRRALFVVSLAFAILAIGMTGMVGYLLAPDLLFGWARSARMAVHTATGMILCGIGFGLFLSKKDWYISGTYFTEVGKIRFLSAAIMLIVAVTIGLTGFVVLQGRLEKAVQNQLVAVMNNRATWFRTAVQAETRHVYSAIHLSGLDLASKAQLSKEPQAEAELPLTRAADLLVQTGYRRVALLDLQGNIVKAWGAEQNQPAINASLDVNGTATLIWDQMALLRIRQPIIEDSKIVGSLVVDTPAPVLESPLYNLNKIGKTAELAVCVSSLDTLQCLPNTQHLTPFYVDLRSKRGTPLPMELALAGQTGVVNAVDYNQRNVIAAHGLIVAGLGIVAKQETAEAYGPIRQSLTIGFPVVIGISFLGALLLFTQLNPLVLKMDDAKSSAADAAHQLQTIMQAVGDGIVTVDKKGQILSMNTAGYRMFGYRISDLDGKNITMLMPSELRDAHRAGMARVLSGGVARLLGTPNVQVSGLRKDGSSFPLELTINAVSLSGEPHFVGVLRDITVRKEMEEQLKHLAQYDALTGLPNRALFMDRLGTALQRAKRTKTGIALMFIDLDGFKKINDTYGHQGGDSLLVQVAQRLQSAVRKSDTVARLSGDEFTIVLEELTLPGDAAQIIAGKIVTAMQASFRVTGHVANVTASVGLVVHDARVHNVEVTELIKMADDEMYAVKHSGKNAFRTYANVASG